MKKQIIMASILATSLLAAYACDDSVEKPECDVRLSVDSCNEAGQKVSCVDGKLLAVNCDGVKICSKGVCVDPVECSVSDAPSCANDTTVKYCAGGVWEEQNCGYNKVCVSGKCEADPSPKECKPGDAPICLDNKNVKSCGADGAYVTIPCEGNEVCSGGRCIIPSAIACDEEGEKRCYRDSLELCKDRVWELEETCAYGCVENACRAKPEGPVAMGDECLPGKDEYRCDGTKLLVCNATLKKYAVAQDCAKYDLPCGERVKKDGTIIGDCTYDCDTEGELILFTNSCRESSSTMTYAKCYKTTTDTLGGFQEDAESICYNDTLKLSCSGNDIAEETCSSCTDGDNGVAVCGGSVNVGDTCPQGYSATCKDASTALICGADNKIAEQKCADPTPACISGVCSEKPAKPVLGSACTAAEQYNAYCDGKKAIFCDGAKYVLYQECTDLCSEIIEQGAPYADCTSACTVENEEIPLNKCESSKVQFTKCEPDINGNLVAWGYAMKAGYEKCFGNDKHSCSAPAVIQIDKCGTCDDEVTPVVCTPAVAVGDTCPANYTSSCKDDATALICGADNKIAEQKCADPTPLCISGVCSEKPAKPVLGTACTAAEKYNAYCDGKKAIFCDGAKYVLYKECTDLCSETVEQGAPYADCTSACTVENEEIPLNKCSGGNVQFTRCEPDNDGNLVTWIYGASAAICLGNDKHSCSAPTVIQIDHCGTCSGSGASLICTPAVAVGDNCPANYSPVCKDDATALICGADNKIAEQKCADPTSLCKGGVCVEPAAIPKAGDSCVAGDTQYCDGDAKGLYCNGSIYVAFTCQAEYPCRTTNAYGKNPVAECVDLTACEGKSEGAGTFYTNSCQIGDGDIFLDRCLKTVDGVLVGFPEYYKGICGPNNLRYYCVDKTETGLKNETCTNACTPSGNNATCS